MKTNISLIALIAVATIVATTVNAQVPECLLDSEVVYTKDNLPQTKTVYTYDEEGYIIAKKGQVWKNNEWTDRYLYTYAYDSEERLVASEFSFWSNISYSNRTEYTYNEKGQLAETRGYNDEKGAWKLSSMNTMSYDQQGRLIDSICYTILLGKREASQRMQRRYSDEGQRAQDTWSITDGNGNLEPMQQLSYIYNEEGKVIREEGSEWNGKEWNKAFACDYKYNEYGYANRWNYYKWQNNRWEYLTYCLYYYSCQVTPMQGAEESVEDMGVEKRMEDGQIVIRHYSAKYSVNGQPIR